MLRKKEFESNDSYCNVKQVESILNDEDLIIYNKFLTLSKETRNSLTKGLSSVGSVIKVKKRIVNYVRSYLINLEKENIGFIGIIKLRNKDLDLDKCIEFVASKGYNTVYNQSYFEKLKIDPERNYIICYDYIDTHGDFLSKESSPKSGTMVYSLTIDTYLQFHYGASFKLSSRLCRDSGFFNLKFDNLTDGLLDKYVFDWTDEFYYKLRFDK